MTTFKDELEKILINLYLGDNFTEQYPNYKAQMENPTLSESLTSIINLVDKEVIRARDSERKLLTWEKLSKKMVESNAMKIEFEVTMKTTCNVPHYCIFASDKDAFEVAIDGQSVVSRQPAKLKGVNNGK